MRNALKTLLYEIAARLTLVVLGILVVIVGIISPHRCLEGIRAAGLNSTGGLILRTRK
jgi:hypothetical protein